MKARSEQYEAHLDFPVGKSVILPDFMNNQTELRNIREMFSAYWLNALNWHNSRQYAIIELVKREVPVSYTHLLFLCYEFTDIIARDLYKDKVDIIFTPEHNRWYPPAAWAGSD